MGKIKSPGKRFWLMLCLTLIWMGLIFWFSAQNSAQSSHLSGSLLNRLLSLLYPHWADKTYIQQQTVMQKLHTIFRKLGHFSEYAVLGALLVLTVRRISACISKSRQASLFRGFFLPALLAFLYACSDELHQRFVAGRSGELRDVMIDFCGACFGIAVAALLSARQNKGI